MGEDQGVEGTILQGPNGELYVFSRESLDAHRLPDEVAARVTESLSAAAGDSEVSGFGGFQPGKGGGMGLPPLPTFQVLAMGPIIRTKIMAGAPNDTQFDPL